ncbi:MAG: hypothetical protein IKM97_03235 [Clostridia bacterium]|nr:hypothetical protein [Clostridia bacterium]
MKNKMFISLVIFLYLLFNSIPIFSADFESIPVWSDTSEFVYQTSSEPSFDIKSESGILIEVTTRKGFI